MRSRLPLLGLLVVLAMLAIAPTAPAKTVELVAPTGESFTGSDTTAGAFSSQVDEVAVHQGTGTVLVLDRIGVVRKFNSGGVASNFSGLGASSFSTAAGGVPAMAIDNSATATNGNFYTAPESGPLRAFASTGVEIGGNFPLEGLGVNCGAAVDPQGDIWVSDYNSSELIEFNSSGSPTGNTVETPTPCRFTIDTNGNFYAVSWSAAVRKYDSDGNFLYLLDPNGTNSIAVDPSNNDVYVDHGSRIDVYDSSGSPITSFGQPEGLYGGLSNSQGVAVNGSTGKIYVSNADFSEPRVDVFAPTGPITVPDVTTEDPEVEPTSAVLHGKLNPDGVATTECFFQWGPTTSYGNTIDCAEGKVFAGSDDQAVSAEITGLTQGDTYHFRLVAMNANGVASVGADREFKPQGPPVIIDPYVDQVNTDGARLNVEIDPNGGFTQYHFEWGTEDCALGGCVSTATEELPSNVGSEQVSTSLAGLGADTAYHFRIVATNANGTTTGDDNEFRTFPNASLEPDTCPNAQARQQTGAALLLDCRAYELVSAANTGGYDVLSDLVPGQQPPVAEPGAGDAVLYSLHFGTIPGIAGNPTNFGPDPYVATRGGSGWTTRYVGIDADGTPDEDPFASSLLDASGDLRSFVFGGPDLCDPCFADGTGIPVRGADGTLFQGMAGSLPGALVPAGYVAKSLSDDGTHLVFGSASRFEEAADEGTVSIYDRDLSSDSTQVVSTLPDGSTMSGEVGQLDISADGSRIVVGELRGTDPAGNRYWHPYLHLGTTAATVDLAPGSTSGVTYAGRTADGDAYFFVSRESLTGDDGDDSADLYRADVEGDSASLTLLSGDGSDSCDPVSNPGGPHWNVVGTEADCSVAAFAGGAGVGGDGTVFFLSPQQLDGSEGVADEPNLYVVRPGDGDPTFVATLEADDPAVRNAVADTEAHSYGDFQVTGNGDYAAFDSRLPLTGFPNLGFAEVYRYATASGKLDCVSCATTGAAPKSDARLSDYGLNLTEDGRVFFTSAEALVLRDTNGRKDAYQWKDGQIQVVSTGASGADSGLLSVTPDGVNAFFFTREVIVPQDRNGTTMKVYVARQGGGFPTLPSPVPCQASDECHGPGTPQPGPMDIGTLRGAGGQHADGGGKRKRCKRSQVKRRGKCVSKKKHGKRKGKKRKSKSGGRNR